MSSSSESNNENDDVSNDETNQDENADDERVCTLTDVLVSFLIFEILISVENTW